MVQRACRSPPGHQCHFARASWPPSPTDYQGRISCPPWVRSAYHTREQRPPESPTRFEDRRCADKMRDVFHFGRDGTVRARWGCENDLFTVNDLGGDAEHERRRG